MTPGFKATYDWAFNVAVNQGLSPRFRRAATVGVNATADSAVT